MPRYVLSRRPRVALVAMCLLALGATAMTAPAAGAATKITKGGNFTFIGADPGSFDPARMGTYSTTGAVGTQVYDSLGYLDPKTGEFRGRLLESLSGSPDAKVWTMKLRKGIKFTDGTTFDSAAIKANFDYHVASPTSQGAGWAKNVASWDVSDPQVAKLTLTTANSVFPIDLVTRMVLMASPTALAKYGADYGTSPDKIVGAGPFTLTSWVRGSQMVFTRNPNYWDAPRPYLDTVTIKVLTDPTVAFNTALTGGSDWAAPSTQALFDQAKGQGWKMYQYYPNNVTFHPIYFLNLQRAPFNDLIARQAMYACLDPKKVANAAQRPVSNSIFDKDSVWYSENGVFPKYDPKQCQELINQWSSKNGGKTLEFTITDVQGSQQLGGAGEAIQAAFSQYQNIKVNVQQVTIAQWGALGPSGNFDAYATAVGGVDPNQAYDSAYPTGASRNFSKWSNPDADAAVKAANATSVFAQRKKAYDQLQAALMKDLPTWFMPYTAFVANNYFITNKSVQGVTGGQWTGPYTPLIWIKKGK